MRGGAQDPDSSAGVLDHREHVQSRPGQGDRLEEIAGQQHLSLGAQEIGPVSGAALGCRVDPGLAQDLPDGGRGDLHPEHQQFAVHPAISPAGILADQAEHQDADRAHGPRQAGMPGPGPAGVSAPHRIAVPAEYGIRAHQQVQPVEQVPREPVQQCRQQRPVDLGEPHPCSNRAAAAGPRAGGAVRGSLCLCPGCSSAAAAGARTHSLHRGKPVAAARLITMPRRFTVTRGSRRPLSRTTSPSPVYRLEQHG